MLIDKGANVNLQDNEGMTALIWGCKADSQVANALLDAGADIHLCDEVKTN
jgi:ankyrin repeat protein